MQPGLKQIAAAERAGRRRAALFPILGTLLIVANAILSGAPHQGLAATAAWFCVFVAGFVLAMTGGVWSRSLRGLVNDETTRAYRRNALMVGYGATIACSLGLSITVAFIPLDAVQVVRIILATAIGAPLISFGFMERMALDDV